LGTIDNRKDYLQTWGEFFFFFIFFLDKNRNTGFSSGLSYGQRKCANDGLLSYFQVEAPIHRPSFFLFFSLTIKDKTKISLTIKILHLGQGSFTRKVKTILHLGQGSFTRKVKTILQRAIHR
jgi:hypothetical protein